ncbi:MAG TPA: TlpA disulfide reductase family protein [Mucilaginibacter sp.]|jgi:Thiol-disulfide isomerase and thioredoxins
MLKSTFILALAVFTVKTVSAQKAIDRPIKAGTASAPKTFDLTIKLDSSINPKKAYLQYYDGKNLQLLSDTVGLERVVHIRKKYYSPLATFEISFLDSARNGYSKEFFIGDKPAMVTLHYKPGTDHELIYSDARNVTPVFDSSDTKNWGWIIKMRALHSQKEAALLENFMKNNPNFQQNDSLKNRYGQLYKAYIRKDMSYLKQAPADYFSFWFFVHQSSQLNGVLSKDKAFLQEQLTFLKTTFPAKFTGNAEGRYLTKKFEDKINAVPLQLNQAIPAFTVTGTDGKKISLKQLKGRYVLLDFWATWCGPCMAEMPFVKDIRKKYPAEKLAIIGISSDMDKQHLLTGIQKNSITWPQYLDNEKKIGILYSVEAIPTMILLDKEGKMIYRSNFLQSDQDKLPKLLESLN